MEALTKLSRAAYLLPSPLRSYAFAILLKLSSSLRQSYRQFQIDQEKEKQNQFLKSAKDALLQARSERVPLTQIFAADQGSNCEASHRSHTEVQVVVSGRRAD